MGKRRTPPSVRATGRPDPDPVVLRVRSPEDLLAAVPFLLGFHPRRSLVAVGLAAARRRTEVTARFDLPPPGSRRQPPSAVAAEVAGVLAHPGIAEALLVAYDTDPGRADPVVAAVRAELARRSVAVPLALRADGERWWAYPAGEEGTPSAGVGTAYELETNPVTGHAVYAGLVALPDREMVRASVAPVAGESRSAMAAAIRRAEQTRRGGVQSSGPGEIPAMVRRLLGSPGRLTDDQVAELAVAVAEETARDAAWMLIDRDDVDRHLGLWQDVLRRVLPPYELAPAILTAFAAWYAGNGALAWCAVERAQAADPDDGMAELLAQLLARGIPPWAWDEHSLTGTA